MGSRDWKRAVRYVREIITATEEAAYRRIYGVNLGNLGECLLELGQLARAGEMVTEALAVHREFDWDMGIADTLWNLSRIARARNRMADALPYAREAVERAELTTDTNLQGRTMLELAVVLQANRMYDESMAAYQGALDHTRSAGDRVVEARVLERVAVLHHERGNLQSARVSHELSIDISREIGERWYLALSLDRFAETMDRLRVELQHLRERITALEKEVEQLRKP